jgi:hypothetical protein
MDRALSLRFLSHRLRCPLAIGTLSVVALAGPAGAQTLQFVQEPPASVSVGGTFAVHVQVLGTNGLPDGGFNPNVVLSLAGGAPGLLGTTSRKVDADGTARFENLSITIPGSYRIVATGGPAVPDTSSTVVVQSAATDIEFLQQPTDTDAGTAISPAVTVRAVSAPGVTDLTFTGDITIAIGTNPAGGTLSGTKTVAAVNGVATFSDLSIDKAGTSYTLDATAGAMTASSNPFEIRVGPASGATTQITAAPTSIPADGSRSEERRVGQEGACPSRTPWSPEP